MGIFFGAITVTPLFFKGQPEKETIFFLIQNYKNQSKMVVNLTFLNDFS